MITKRLTKLWKLWTKKNTLSRNNIFPGPGEYYSEYGNAIIPPKPKDIKFQNFGSSQSRSTNSISRSYSNNILDNLLLFPSLPNKIKNEYDKKGNLIFEGEYINGKKKKKKNS